jgi:protoporphyrinogen oxidase
MKQRAIIIGAGPAGLTAAYELLTRSAIVPIVLEKSEYMGGLSRTVEYKGNRIDIGGHRFFSKSDRVVAWWLRHMPLERNAPRTRGTGEAVSSSSNSDDECTMLLRSRKSRIYFLRKFFEYPITLSVQTLKNLGMIRTLKIGLSYLRVAIFPPRHVENLEEFFTSRFGRELYKTFFESYTEKVWGVPCNRISAEWGAQRIKGLSIKKALLHIWQKTIRPPKDVRQKGTETSLIEQFMYPRLGPGQMWEIVARKVVALGGEIVTDFNVDGISVEGDRVFRVSGTDSERSRKDFDGDYVFSTMPVKDLLNAFGSDAPEAVKEIGNSLQYRDFITVGLLVNQLVVRDETSPNGLIKDNWIYIQEPEVKAGRLQIFNNWSPYMVENAKRVWLGVEYFCNQGDALWNLPEEEMAALAKEELETIGIIRQSDVLDSLVIRMEKAYPAYFGSYQRFPEVCEFLDGFKNLFLIGRNGMHSYNNQDHSMLAAMTAVDNIIAGRTDKSNIWAVNTEEDYHEERKA